MHDGFWSGSGGRASRRRGGGAPACLATYSPSYTVQQQGCGTVSGLTFHLSCTSTSGYDRAERRYVDYSSGQRRFQGSFRITSMGGSRISLKQTFHDDVGPFFLLAVENGGRLYSVEGGATVASGATVGTTVAVQTIHTVGSKLQVYINGSLKFTESAPDGGNYYDKVGAYRTSSGSGPITVVWSNLAFAYQ
ncbi:hypothetical protein [Fodinicola feengrottensis]|uniref:hypothetical protein n=1 Tax=Fodinicola feengrottensis TaxID=435914 RepID=UPI00244307D8|nr:hypothetical protein [Fodinicola feengrottensis]